jgi:hypothetical protein
MFVMGLISAASDKAHLPPTEAGADINNHATVEDLPKVP